MIRVILTASGHEVVTVAGPHEALTVLGRRTVQLLVTDVIMPDMTGYELAAQGARAPGRVHLRLRARRDASPCQRWFHPEAVFRPGAQ
ncbi:MAG: response regulator [Vicinamibacterales bacterium]